MPPASDRPRELHSVRAKPSAPAVVTWHAHRRQTASTTYNFFIFIPHKNSRNTIKAPHAAFTAGQPPTITLGGNTSESQAVLTDCPTPAQGTAAQPGPPLSGMPGRPLRQRPAAILRQQGCRYAWGPPVGADREGKRPPASRQGVLSAFAGNKKGPSPNGEGPFGCLAGNGA